MVQKHPLLQDRVGIGWRPELASGILPAVGSGEIDVLEVLAGETMEKSGSSTGERISALKFLATRVPIHIHCTNLGLAGAEEVSSRRVEQLARLVNAVEPEAWSEHLAFIRAGGIEIGHLAAPPRTKASVAAAVRNLRKAAQIVGSVPHMENIATLMEPPCSTMNEQEWISQIVATSGCHLLLDLHNLHANATNFGLDARQFLSEIPLERVRYIHIAGGKWINSPDGGKQYLLDDHLHGVDEAVYTLLTEVAARTSHPLTAILERDGAYPPMPILLHELQRARGALRAGRAKRDSASLCAKPLETVDRPADRESCSEGVQAHVERFLAQLFADDEARQRFLANPQGVAHEQGLTPEECAAIALVPAQDLQTAARSYERKRMLKADHNKSALPYRLLRLFRVRS